jgi:hypothetical protein
MSTGARSMLRARREHPLSSVGLDVHGEMFTLTVDRDGTRQIREVQTEDVIHGFEVGAHLPREIWQNPARRPSRDSRASRAHRDKEVSCEDASGHSSKGSCCQDASWHSTDTDASSHSRASKACSKPDDIECPICLGSIDDGDSVTRFVCAHPLHSDCASQWFSSQISNGLAGSCPMWYAPAQIQDLLSRVCTSFTSSPPSAFPVSMLNTTLATMCACPLPIAQDDNPYDIVNYDISAAILWS